MSEVARSLPSQPTSGAAASAGPAGPTGRFKAVEAWAAEDEPELKSDGRRARARSPRAPWEPLGAPGSCSTEQRGAVFLTILPTDC